MRKIFLTICFMISCYVTTTYAKVTEMNEVGQEQRQPKVIDTSLPQGMPDPDNLDEVIKFFRERFQTASKDYVKEGEDLNKSDSINIQHSKEYLEQMQEQNKSFFEKIYDKAMGRISNINEEDTVPSKTIFYQLAEDDKPKQVIDPQMPTISAVNVTLPSGKRIIAPAREHIPYLLSSYNILPTGLIQVQEDVTVVNNGQKLKHGLSKILNKYSVSRANVRKKIDVQLISVSINGQEIPYILEEIGDRIYIKPKNEYTLQPGVYNYSFKYLMDRKLWYYDDFSEFYVDVSGSYLNLVIASANAIVSVPDGRNFMSQNVIVGSPSHFSERRAMIASLASNALGFASTTSLLPAEGMHILVSLDKNVFISPDFNRRLVWFITDYGDVLISFCGFIAILLSYLLSWRYIKRHQKQKKSAGFFSPAALRNIFTGKFDQRCFVSGLLDLYRKNVIDLQNGEKYLLLIKKTDNLNSLSLSEKKVMTDLFPGRDTVLELSASNMLKMRRAFVSMKKGTELTRKLISLKFSLGYLLFSLGMLIFSEAAISYLAFNPAQMALILLSCSLTIAFYIWILKKQIKNKIMRWIIRGAALLFIVFSVLLISVYTRLISAVMIALMIYCVFEFEELFTKRNGLIKSIIREADDMKKQLRINAETIGKSQQFIEKQPYIFAYELENLYPLNEYNKSSYKLTEAEKMLSLS